MFQSYWFILVLDDIYMNRLIELLKQWNIDIDDNIVNKFNRYYDLLIEWNEKINLTAITEPEDVLIKHFLDSSALLKYIDLSGKSIIDVGTGAGFPGIVLKILNPSCKITLLDSLNKRVLFLNEVITELGLKDIYSVHGRAEDFAHNSKYRENYDIVTSRAVANLSTLSEYCIPFAKAGGFFVPYKSGSIDEEIDEAKRALSILNSSVTKVEKYSLPDTDYERSLVFIHKDKSTTKQYPRKAGTPSKSPL